MKIDASRFPALKAPPETVQAPKPPSKSLITLSTLMMPEHANHLGNVHGGVIMKLVDEAAAIAAMRHAGSPAVTVAMDSMSFKQPVQVGDLLICNALVTFTHRSSMEVEVHVTAEDPVTGETTHTNSAYLVFVALGADARARAVPALLLETDDDRERFEAGAERQRARLARRGNERAFPHTPPSTRE